MDKKVKNKIVTSGLAFSMLVVGISGCGNVVETDQNHEPQSSDSGTEESILSSAVNESTEDMSGQQASGTFLQSDVPLLGNEEEIYYNPNLVPCVEPYSVASDFSNVVYDPMFSYLFDENSEYSSEYAKELVDALIKNNFAVEKDGYTEFFDVYESNRYNMFPSFITVDSLMHTYHLYFAYLMKKTEENYLADKLYSVSTQMLERTMAQYEALKGSSFEKAALANLEFFYVAALLQDENIIAPLDDAELSSVVKAEYDKVMSAQGIDVCLISELNEDYSQYKPRGYYDGNEKLEKYFRAMMWYGRIPFSMESEEKIKSTLLMCNAISQEDTDYNSIYSITSFFAGASDDIGYCAVRNIVEEVYGSNPDITELAADDSSFAKVCEALKHAEPAKINSVPVYDGEEPVSLSYRFMGQRFTVDAAIMQMLIYESVKEDNEGNTRMLPDTLDVPAALGSEKALEILDEQGDTKYENYTDNMTFLQQHYNTSDPKIWNASLYSGWLNTLRPLLEEKGEGYPSYMQSDEWAKKNLETFAGSYAELKHDTILYAKQVMAEMGGPGEDYIPDDRGYVDPQPVVYSRFVFLADKTKEGLKSLGMLDEAGEENLQLLSDIAMKLLNISEKELQNEKLTDEEYDFIRCYGGDLEHFWIEVNKENQPDLAYSYQAPCQVIADIATDPNGTVLEVGSGNAAKMFVVFPIDGELHVGSGSVYSFYQFETTIDNRLTDEQWRQMLEGGYLNDDWEWVETEKAPEQPDWTLGYRIGY